MKEKNIFDESTMRALKQCITGTTTKEITTEYSVDDNGELKIVKQKINEKTIPPNVDIIKLVYQHFVEETVDYEKMSDEDLEKEKNRLIKLLKEEKDVSGKSKSKNKM